MPRATRQLTIFILLLALPALLLAQDPAAAERESYIRLHYAKQEVKIKMRDSVELFTAIYTPRDTSKKYPILIKRTPYSSGPYGVDKYPSSLGPSEHFVKAGYIFVNQDVRGRFEKELVTVGSGVND